MFHVRVVEVVSDKGIAQVFHMDTDLMGAAGFQLKGDQAQCHQLNTRKYRYLATKIKLVAKN